jgi:hypothetical protein
MRVRRWALLRCLFYTAGGVLSRKGPHPMRAGGCRGG